MKTVWTGPEIIIDGVDAESLKEDEISNLINWGFLMIKKVNKEGGNVTSVDATDNTDFKNFINKDTKVEKEMIGDPVLRNMKKGDMVHVHLQRCVTFICDME